MSDSSRQYGPKPGFKRPKQLDLFDISPEELPPSARANQPRELENDLLNPFSDPNNSLPLASSDPTIEDVYSAAQPGQAEGFPRRLLIDPLQNVLIGSQTIRKYLKIKSIITLYEWHEVYKLPIMKLANGQWMTTISAIDEWIWMASELERTNRPYSRGDNKRAELALKKAQRRVERLKAREAELGSREAAIAAAAADLKDSA